MPAKARRHHRISALIAARALRSQEELRSLLADEGIEVTQATLSRDLKELGVSKGPQGFTLPGGAVSRGVDEDALGRALSGEVLAADCAASLLVLRTLPGHAGALAIEIDRARLAESAGTVAGDDTVFVATRSSGQARRLRQRFAAIAGLA